MAGRSAPLTRRVLVVEDQLVLAGALEIAINAQPGMECVAAVATVEEAMPLVARQRPDVVLMDIHLPGVDGIEGVRRVKELHPETRVLILTGDPDLDLLAAAATAGAAGFLVKDSPLPEILTAIAAPADGTVLVEGTTLATLLGQIPPAPSRRAAAATSGVTLTRRELEVLTLMGEGLHPKGIAERLVVSEHTARGHVKNIMMKLGAHSQLEAVVVATRTGVLPSTARPRPRR